MVIPINKGMIDISAIRDETEREKEEDLEVQKQIKEEGLQNKELEKARSDWAKVKEANFR